MFFSRCLQIWLLCDLGKVSDLWSAFSTAGYMIPYWVVTQVKRGSAGKPPSPCLAHSKLPSLLQHMLPLSCFITASESSRCN